ncbi:hypothetical protein ABH922_002771 [Rhodococcus sp. 27YEA15]|uniref:hypothetical protein n=1 Tax=Rhodococcus sp. 27YEA15 TaxID=3156259 RepID=UPI003C7C1452
MTDIVERATALAAAAQFGHLTTGVSSGDHWYVCDENEVVAHIAANDGLDEELRQPRVELIVLAVNHFPALVAEVQALRATVAAVEALHVPVEVCGGEPYCRECGCQYPCDTRRASETKP